MDIKIERFKQQFFSDNFDIRMKAIDYLKEIKTDSMLNFFIDNLKHEDRKVQFGAASALRYIADKRAIMPLLEAIKKTSNKGYVGSFVYALQKHDCKSLFIPLIEITLNSTYEGQSHALEILSRQKFDVSKGEILRADKMIEDYLKSEHKCADYEILIKELRRYIKRIERSLKK